MSTVTVRRRHLILAVTLALLLSAVWVARSDSAGAFLAPPGEGVDVVYVAVGSNFPDALGVGPAGGINNAPIILVPTDPPIPAVTESELVRLDPRKLIIVGGTTAITTAMQGELAELLPAAVIERLDGANRYETNTMLSESVYPVEVWISIPASAFTVDHVGTDDAYIGVSKAFNLTDGTLLAPVQLPHGATILEFKVIGRDVTSGDMHINLDRAVGNAPETVAYVLPTGTPGDFEIATTSITNGVVDNESSSYYVYVTNTGGDREIVSAHIRYRLGTPGS